MPEAEDLRQSESEAAAPLGAKKLDYPWTVLVVDPLAGPLTKLLAARRWLTPDQVTGLSLALGVPVGLAFATGTRAGLRSGAGLFYVSFVCDCVDGKLARALDLYSARGVALDEWADKARRASAALGLAVYLGRVRSRRAALWALGFGALSVYFMEISGAERPAPATPVGGRWRQALARRRLLPTPGMPDVSGIVFVLGPATGWVLPGLGLGTAMVAAGIALTAKRTRAAS
ncbi:MAG: CDP-alcohol phosphatidyltransferase family protein [Actinobacteria bacterium]|nr:CDP-alcohol phosphatidyltransferase family protein [Actinomycetota bacterium]